MKIKLPFLSALLILLLLSGLNSMLYSQPVWQVLPASPTSPRLDDIYFITPDIGWAVSPSYEYYYPPKEGQIWKTTDGGLSWQLKVDSSSTFFRAVGFADSLTGWVGNLAKETVTPDTNAIYHTSDGGNTWAPVMNIPAPKPAGICGISVVTDSVIYAYGRWSGPAIVVKTTDKGATWTSMDLGAYASGLVDGRFFSADTGFIVGAKGTYSAVILYTTDGGNTWAEQHVTPRTNELAWKITFPSRLVGYVSIEKFAPNGDNHFLKTIDGGLTWQEMIFPNPAYDLEGIGFATDSIGWIGGDNTAPNYMTTDGGNTWQTDNNFGVQTPWSADFGIGFHMNRFRRFSDTLMYACGNTVYKYTSENITGINNHYPENTLLKYYPNPFQDQLTIEMNGNAAFPCSIILYDQMGRKVREITNIQSSANPVERVKIIGNGLSSGLYNFVITDRNDHQIGRGKVIAYN